MVMKTRYFIPLLLALAAVSCNKEKAIEENTSGELVELTASIGTPATKIHFAGDMGAYTDTRWEDGDQLWVRSDTQPYWERGDCFTATGISSDGHSATFVGRTRTDGKLCAVYPYGLVAPGSDNAKILLDVPAERAMVAGDCPARSIAAAAFISDGGTALQMNYLFGAIRFSITGSGETLSKAELVDAGGAALWGTLEIVPDYAGNTAALTMANTSLTRSTVTLSAAGMSLGSTPLDFYFVLPEGSLGKGFSLILYDSADKAYVFSSKDAANVITCGKVVKMPAVDISAAGGNVDKPTFSQGTGTQSDPYVVATSDDLVTMMGLINDETTYPSYMDKYFSQTADIDMAGVFFAPIGVSTQKPFKGHYLGGGHKVSNLTTGGASSDCPASGIFGYAEDAVIDGVVVEGRVNNGTFNRVGGVVGYAKNCTVSECRYVGGELTGTTNMCAGIVGHQVGGLITDCEMTGGKITSTGPYAAGIVAYCTNLATVRNCTVSGGSVISGTYGIGGICARLDNGVISGCVFKGASAVEASSYYAAAIVGSSIGDGGCTIDKCFVLDNCNVSATYCAAGILGYVYPNASQSIIVSNCGVLGGTIRSTSCDTGADPAKGDCMSAGIVGWLRTSNAGNKGVIINCFVYVSPGGFPCTLAMSHPSVGGIVGYVSTKNDSGNEILVANCATTTVQSDITIAGSPVTNVAAAGRVGAIFGWGTNSDTVTFDNCCYLSTSDLTIGGGSCVVSNCTGYDAATFKDGSTALGKLNGYATACSDYALSSWTANSDGLPVLN